MKLKEKFLIIFTLFLIALLLNHNLYAATIGSDSAVSFNTNLQTINSGDRVARFISLEGGLDLVGGTFTFDSLFPVGGPIGLNSGNMVLTRDLHCTSTYFSIASVGEIIGEGNSIFLGPSIRELIVDSVINPGRFTLAAVGGAVSAFDWESGDNYLSICSSAPQLSIYSFDGTNLAAVPGATANPLGAQTPSSVVWNPVSNYIAMAYNYYKKNKNNFYLYNFNSGTGALTQISARKTREYQALAWNSGGDLLFTGSGDPTIPNAYINIYDFNTGTGALSWAAQYSGFTGRQFGGDSITTATYNTSYFAVGLDQNVNGSELSVMYYDNAGTINFVIAPTGSLGADVTSVDWSLKNTTTYIAAGLNGSIHTLRVYSFDSSSGTLSEVASIEDSSVVSSVSWNPEGDVLSVGLLTNAGPELRNYNFDGESLSLLGSVELGTSVSDVKWSYGGDFLGVASDGNLELYVFVNSIDFENVNVILDVDLTLKAPVKFSGESLVNCKKNSVIIPSDVAHAGIIVANGAELTLENTILDLNKSAVFTLEGADSKVNFHDCIFRLNSDVYLPLGSFSFDGNVDVIGSNTLFLSSPKTSTINAYSSLSIKDGATLFLGKVDIDTEEPLTFIDETSKLNLENASLHITSTGSTLTKGQVHIGDHVVFDMDSLSEQFGLHFGDGVLTDNDLEVHIAPGSVLDLKSGHLVFDNISDTKVVFDGLCGQVLVDDAVTLCVNSNLSLYGGSLVFQNPASFCLDPGVFTTLHDTKVSCTADAYISQLTGTMDIMGEIYLQDNDIYTLIQGEGSPIINISGQNSILQGIGQYDGQIVLNDSDSSVLWRMKSKISQDVLLNGGTFYVQEELDLKDGAIFKGGGIVDLDNQVVRLSYADHVETGSVYWDGSTKGYVCLLASTSLSSTWTFGNNCVVHGHFNELDLIDSGALVVDSDSSLELNNLILKNINGNNLRCVSDSSNITIANSVLYLSDNFSFTMGGFTFKDVVCVFGDYVFSYDSAMASTISPNSALFFDSGSTFSIGGVDGMVGLPLEMTDETSSLNIKEASLYVGAYGLNLLKGNFNLYPGTNINIEKETPLLGLQLGDGLNAENDCPLRIYGDINFYNGAFVYNNISNDQMKLHVGGCTFNTPAKFYLSKSLSIDSGFLSFPDYSSCIITDGSYLESNDSKFKVDTTAYSLTGTYTDFSIIRLSSNDSLSLLDRDLTSDVYIYDNSAHIGGFGSLIGDITLKSDAGTLNIRLLSNLNGNIVLNGGTLVLDNDLKFVDGKSITGSGTIYLNSKTLSLGDLSDLGSVSIQAPGILELNNSLSLYTTVTMDGDITFQGHGNVFNFVDGGRLFVRSGNLEMADLVLRNLNWNLTLTPFEIADQASIEVSNVDFDFSSDFSFTSGDILVNGPATFNLKDKYLTFDNFSTLSIDAATAWIDSLEELGQEHILFNSDLNLALLNGGRIRDYVSMDELTNTWIELDSRLTATYGYLLDELQTTSEYLDISITNTWIELNSRLTSTYEYLGAVITNTWIELGSRLAPYTYIYDNINLEDGDILSDVFFVKGTAYLPDSGTVYADIFGGVINNLDMNNGTLHLLSDLTIAGQLIGSGIIDSGSELRILRLQSQQSWTGVLTFNADTIIEGDDQIVNFNNIARLIIKDGAIVTLRNVLLHNLSSNWVTLEGTGRIIL